MPLIDSHAHLDDRRYSGDRAAVIEEIQSSGVTNVINIGADMKSSRASVELAEKYDFIYAAVGVHPHDAKSMKAADIETLRKLSEHKKVVAIGEIGLDFYYDHSDRDAQRYWFREQLKLAKEVNLPVIIHDRDAHAECLEILREFNVSHGVMHCYSGSAEMAREVLEMGLHIAFGGVLTFKNARAAVEALKAVPLDRLLLETDCPYLSPEPFRGQRNTSAYMPYIARKAAEIKGVGYDEICEITSKNVKDLFNF